MPLGLRKLPVANRAECVDGPRPCQRIECPYHLFLDRKDAEHHRLPSHRWTPDLSELERMPETCAIDVADRVEASGELMTLENVAALFNCSREWVRQIEEEALRKLRRALNSGGVKMVRLLKEASALAEKRRRHLSEEDSLLVRHSKNGCQAKTANTNGVK